MLAAGISLAVWAVVLAVSDFRQRRVPNSLLLLVAVPAIASQLFLERGLLGIGSADAALGAAVGFTLTFIGYLVRQVGAGDVKYAAVLGLLTGKSAIMEILLISALFIGLLSLAALLQASWNKAEVRKVPAAVALSAAFLIYLAGRIQQ